MLKQLPAGDAAAQEADSTDNVPVEGASTDLPSG